MPAQTASRGGPLSVSVLLLIGTIVQHLNFVVPCPVIKSARADRDGPEIHPH